MVSGCFCCHGNRSGGRGDSREVPPVVFVLLLFLAALAELQLPGHVRVFVAGSPASSPGAHDVQDQGLY